MNRSSCVVPAWWAPVAVVLAAGCPVAGLAAVDFRFSPPAWQTAICLPDDPHKSLVDRGGELLDHYQQGGREFGTRVGVEVVEGAEWLGQDLVSPRVPIVRTRRGAAGLEILEEAFAVTGGRQAGAHTDLILVRVANTGDAPRTLHPRLVVDTRLPFAFDAAAREVRVDGRETITAWPAPTVLADEQVPRRALQLEPLTIPARGSARLFVRYSGGGAAAGGPATVEEALACRARAVDFWERAPLPHGRVQVPDANVQALLDSSVRNIWQAREIKDGLPVFQVGPTCYRGLWIVDGAFLLEVATMLGAGAEARNGVAYELTFQQPDGRIEVMPHYWKENGIVLWTCVRHARLTRDRAWLAALWPRLGRVAGAIRELRRQTLANDSPADDGLMPAGFPDGGIEGVIDEHTNTCWNLAGLRAFVGAARWLGREREAAEWQREHDDFLGAFRRAAARDARTDAHGHRYLPARMDGAGLPQRGQWAFCHAVYPGQVFARGDPLVAGTLAMLEATEREGMVHGTGWDASGIWNYFASFYGHAWLWQGRGGKAADALAAFANHAAPTLVWREEQSLRGEPFRKVGDMPHNWASAEFIRLAIHLLALERGSELHLLEGLPRAWAAPGAATRLTGVVTEFGPLTMGLEVSADGRSAVLQVEPLADPACTRLVVHTAVWSGADRPPLELDPGRGHQLTLPVGDAGGSSRVTGRSGTGSIGQ